MSVAALKVQQELVALGLRTQPRGLVNGVVFALLTVVLVWPGLPHVLVAAWLSGMLLIAAARLAISRAFAAAATPVTDPDAWARRAAFGYGATGLGWGAMAVACIVLAPGAPLYALWVAFLLVLFAILSAQTTASHPWVFRAFVFCEMTPFAAAMALTDAPHYWLRLLALGMVFGMVLLVGRSGHRYVVDSIRMRFENLELLRDLERQKEELDRANAAKTRFLAAASHDLRQPMQALVLLVESLQDGVKNPVNRRIAASVHATVESMSALLNEILDVSRLDAGTVLPQRTSFPISTVLDRLHAAYAFSAGRKPLELRVRGSDCIVSTDAVLLYRILGNLVANALRYTDQGGVLIACRKRDEGLWVEVWDTGIGIPHDQFEAIFQEFHQLRNAHRDREQGFGLGLAIVDRTARLLQLPLEVRSRLGRGSVFRLRVPYGDPAEVKAAESARLPEPLQGCRVLVVEDDVQIRSAMLLLLEGWQCEGHAAASGPELDALLERLPGPPDVLITDFRLPGPETGIEIVVRLRERFPGIAGILVSGDVDPAVLRAAREANIELLHKPLRPARLRALLGSTRPRTATTAAAAVENA